MLPSPPRLLVFDLDGTLIDSRTDLVNSVNATLAHFARPELSPADVSSYIGDGASTLVRRAFAHSFLALGQTDPHDNAFIDRALDWFLAYYKVHKLDATTVYPGVLDSLTAIRDRHPSLPMAVLTNKPVHPSRDLCQALGMAPFFFANYGGNSFATKKPDPEGLLALIAQAAVMTGISILPAETVMIGDSHVDIETAHNAGTASVACLYGLSPQTLAASRPDVTVTHASDWPAVLGL